MPQMGIVCDYVLWGTNPGFVMLNEVKHLADEWNQRPLPCPAQILRWRSELALSAAEGMTNGVMDTPLLISLKNQADRRPVESLHRGSRMSDALTRRRG